MKRFLLFFLFFSVGGGAFAQSWVHEILDASNGLPSSECISILQDHTGHLWVGTTAGISRYDGYGFENISETGDGQRLGKVNVIREDEQQVIWIGTDAGLFVRTLTGDFRQVARNKEGASGINDLVVTKDEIWMAGEIGALKIPRASIVTSRDTIGTKLNLTDFIIPAWRQQAGIRLIYISQAEDGTVYVAGIHAVLRYNHQQFTRLFATTSPIDQIMALIPVDSTLLYVYSSQENFHKITDGKTSLIDPKVELTFKGGNPVIVLRAMGLYEFDLQSETITRKIDLIDDGILWSTQCVLDDAGIYWIASHDGLVKLKRSYFNEVPFNHPSTYPEVYSITESRDKNLMLGSNRGLIFQRKNEIITRVKDVNPNAEVFDMIDDAPSGTWYATGYEGIVRENGNTSRIFTEKDGLHNNSTNAFFKTRNGRLFVTGDKGITEILSSGKISLKPYYFGASQTQYATFYDGVETSDGAIWVAGQEGVARVEGDSLVSFPLENRYIYVSAMKKDATDTLWLAVNGEGIWQCYADGSELKVKRKFTLADGLPTTAFISLFLDRDDNVWVGHYQGVTLIKHKDKSIMSFDQKDGWPFRNYHHLNFYQDSKGVIWTGCSKGLGWFDPHELMQTRSIPRIFLSAWSAENVEQPSDFSLSYDNRKVNLKYHAVDFPEQASVRYFYKLEGLHSGWTAAGANREVSFDQLQPGDYVFHVRAKNNKGGESAEATILFRIEKPFWQTTWFIVFVVSITALLVFIIVRLREKSIRRNEQQVKSKEIELLSLNRDLAKSRLVALRNQMNPHFIFNALNSIQQFVLEGNVDEANRYLSQFARLQRDILNSSDQDFIFLEKEIEMLKLYLQLEQLRSPNSFHFNITMGEGVDPDELKIPPMLIQPFVENSIWHGLKHREGDKNVSVNFYLENENVLCCVITDNGVGRKTAERVRMINGNARQYPSRGLQLIGERMNMLRQQYNLPFEMFINDVLDDAGNVCGTTVKILLPIEI